MERRLQRTIHALWVAVCLVVLVAGDVLPAFSEDTCGRVEAGEITNASISSFRERTLMAVDSLREISESLRNNQTEIAVEVVRQAKESWCELETTSEYFRLLAEKRSDLCHSRVTELIDRINSLYINQKGLEETLGQLQADLAQAIKDDELTGAEVATLRAKIMTNQRDLAERQQKLQELNDWWWVPGYGLYLAIRAAVDNDEARAQSLIVDLGKLQQEIDKSTGHIGGLRELQSQLNTEVEAAAWSGDSLGAMREDLHGKLGERKGTVVFFAEARSFWDQVQRINLENVGDQLRFIERLQADLGSEASASLLGGETLTLQAELERFAATIDSNIQYLFGDQFDVCSSPRVLTCSHGYVAKDGMCWSICPPEFEEKDRVCVKPPTYQLENSRWSSEKVKMQDLAQDVARMRGEYFQLENDIPNVEPWEQEQMREDQRMLKKDAALMTGMGIELCQEVYRGLGTCKVVEGGFGWYPVCRRNYSIMLQAMTRQYPPPPRRPPTCVPQCPPNMADLGLTCGRDYVVPGS